MKYLIALLFAIIGTTVSQAQVLNFSKEALLPSYNLEISWHKTTMIIFPAPIDIGQRGDGPVLAEKVKGVENALIVKAGQKNFTESNLQVVTRDGKVYSFIVSYNEQASNPTIDLRKQQPFAPVIFKGVSLNEKQIADLARMVAAGKPFLRPQRSNKYGIGFGLEGVYVKDDILFLRFRLKNHTQIRYDAESLRFYVRDKKKSKRTAEQDNETIPLFVHRGDLPEDHYGQTIVAVFPKFTIAEKKFLVAELMEENGDRNPVVKLDQKKLLRAKPVH